MRNLQQPAYNRLRYRVCAALLSTKSTSQISFFWLPVTTISTSSAACLWLQLTDLSLILWVLLSWRSAAVCHNTLQGNVPQCSLGALPFDPHGQCQRGSRKTHICLNPSSSRKVIAKLSVFPSGLFQNSFPSGATLFSSAAEMPSSMPLQLPIQWLWGRGQSLILGNKW